MVRRKEMSNGTVAVGSRPATVPTSKLPVALRFPLLVILSLSLSSLLYSVASDYTAGDLATVSRSLNKWSEVGELIGWRTVELGIGWWAEYDSEFVLRPHLSSKAATCAGQQERRKRISGLLKGEQQRPLRPLLIHIFASQATISPP